MPTNGTKFEAIANNSSTSYPFEKSPAAALQIAVAG
jgi:hypothetical protein